MVWTLSVCRPHHILTLKLFNIPEIQCDLSLTCNCTLSLFFTHPPKNNPVRLLQIQMQETVSLYRILFNRIVETNLNMILGVCRKQLVSGNDFFSPLQIAVIRLWVVMTVSARQPLPFSFIYRKAPASSKVWLERFVLLFLSVFLKQWNSLDPFN